MATTMIPGPGPATLFQRMAEIRATIVQVLGDTRRLHDAIAVPAEEGNAREQAIDLRLQIGRAVRDLEELADDPYGPYALDQPLPGTEVSHE
jgi:hypothetical protein